MNAAEPDEPRHWIWALADDVAEIRFRGPSATLATIAALSSALATIVALALHLDNPWWATITGFIVCQSTRAGSLRKGLLRIAGTIAGAATAFFAMRWIGDDHLACYAFLLGFTTIGVLGFQVSPSAYAWLLSAVTADIVVLSSLEDPPAAFHAAVYRTIEVIVGTLTAFLVTQALSPGADRAPDAPAPGWSDLFGAQWPALLHALRSGVTIMLIPPIWYFFELPSVPSQAGVTAVIVTAVPVQGLDPTALLRKMIERVEHRLFGCFAGGVAALFVLGLGLTEILPWLLMLAGGVWLATYIQLSARGVGYIGLQFGMVFVMTLVQGFGPATSIWVGVDRFGGILLGVLLLFLTSMIITPSSPEPEEETAKADREPGERAPAN